MGEQSYETFEAPVQKKSNRGLIIAIIVIAVLLCCCCVALLAFGWFYGDQILETLKQMGRVMPALPIG